MTPFAALAADHQELEKAAFAKLVSKGLTGIGRFLGRGQQAAGKAMARNAIRESGGIAAVGGRQAASKMQSAGGLMGRRNSTAGQVFRRAGAALGRSEGLQKGVNIGAGTALAGAGLYGANRMGRASGFEEGIEQGADAGMTLGLETAANQMQQNQPGYLGGLAAALKGQAGGNINMGQAYGDMGNNRQILINQLMGR
jgi:hypothetical protein